MQRPDCSISIAPRYRNYVSTLKIQSRTEKQDSSFLSFLTILTVMTVLIVDDIPDMRKVLRIRFESYGFFVFEAEDGADGLKVLNTHPITFVLSDVQMPKMDGIEFLKKAREQFPALPIFIMTGFSPYTEKDILDFGATGYFEKTSIDVRKIAEQFIFRSA